MPTKEVHNISIHELLTVIWRHKLAIALPTLLLAVVFAAYAYYLPERYEARALLAIDPQANPPDVQIPTVEDQLWAVRETVLGRPVLEKVIAEFKLYPSTRDAVDDVKSRITIDVVTAKAFHIGFQGEDPVLVANVVNRLAQLFVNQTASAQTRTIAQADGLLQEELESLRGKLAGQSEQIQNYKERVGGALPERLATNLKAIEVLEDRIQATNIAIVTDQSERAAVLKEMSELEKRGALDPAGSKEQSTGQRKLEELKLELARARTKYTEKNPEVIRLVKQVKNLEQTQPKEERGQAEPSAVSLRYVQLSAELEGIDQHLLSQRQESFSVTSRLRTQRGQVASVPQHENEMALLMRDYATTQANYQVLLAKQNLSGIPDGGSARGRSGLVFTIAEPARPPLTPYSPRRARIVLMGLFAGLGLGSLIAFGRNQMNTSFLNAEDFAAFTSLPVLAEVPSISKVNGGSNAGRVVTVKQPTSVAAELYFTLAAKVRRCCQGKAHERSEGKPDRAQPSSAVVLAVTSATGGEGKTLTSLNLSVALAKSFSGKVLLVDADLRRPMLHEYLELDGANRKGFGDLLLNPEDDIHKYILQYNGVSVMPTFKRVANPLGMLASDSARALLDRMRREFAFVILDSPPIVPIADGHVLANLADHVLLIARARRTPRELFKLAVENFDCSNVIGVALNDVDLKHSRYSSAYRYYQENYQARE